MKIGLDCDGVLRFWLERGLKNIYKKFPNAVKLTPNEISTWNFAPQLKIPDKEMWEFMFSSKYTKDIYLKAECHPAAKEVIEYIKDLGHDVMIVTSQPNKETEEYTKEWVENHKLDVPVIFSNHKHEEDIDVLLDDRVETCVNCYTSNKVVPVVYEQNWNNLDTVITKYNPRESEDNKKFINAYMSMYRIKELVTFKSFIKDIYENSRTDKSGTSDRASESAPTI